ncbi:MAG: transcriptional regulator [Microbacteriaceae bacterium]|jgi:DNA-binding MarR family transcriptional regulator|nr:transcriptional regulator [Microbacteriaceae bacterium]
MTELADEVWWILSDLVTESLGDYRRAVVDAVGMPFSRVRLLRRLAGGPLTLKALAYAATMDAPAATVSINDLVKRGLVTREVSATSGREKLVTLSAEGRAMLDRVLAVRQPAPVSIASLTAEELEQVKAILG